MKKYKIFVGGDLNEIERMMTTLLKRGFVYTSTRRIKTFDGVKKYRSMIDMNSWKYILLGCDDECAAVIGTRSFTPLGFQTITFEEFLKLLK